jgi:ketosteroid isomerase-like protein
MPMNDTRKDVEMVDEVAVVRELLDAVEQRDRERVLACYAEDVEINEAGVLPYGGTWHGHGHEGALGHAAAWFAAWAPHQGPDEIRLDASVWGDGAGNVCALFRHRAIDSATGARIDAPEVSIYRVRNGRIVHAQMFHADSAAVARFLTEASKSTRDGPA